MPLRVVIAGLDPAIHAELSLVRFAVVTFLRRVSMDHRVKPGGDDHRIRVAKTRWLSPSRIWIGEDK